LLWIDLETTGLDPREDHILEVFAAPATSEAPFSIGEGYQATIGLTREASRRLTGSVLDMHTASGLVTACELSTTRLTDVENDLLRMVPTADAPEDRTMLAGRNVGFDLSFIRHHMPLLTARLHYRVMDVSSVEVFCRLLGMPRLEKRLCHRAQDDVREAVNHAVHCITWLNEKAHEGYGSARSLGATNSGSRGERHTL
jgi:oligoribonuclease